MVGLPAIAGRIACMTSSASGAPRTGKAEGNGQGHGGRRRRAGRRGCFALMFKGSAPVVTCNDSEVYEATADFTLDCSVTDEPTGATYSWAARSSTANTDDLSSTTILKPTFDVPNDIAENFDEFGETQDSYTETYEYTVTLSASGITDVTEDVKVTVLEKPDIDCPGNAWALSSVPEGLPDRLLFQGCEEWQGAPVGSTSVPVAETSSELPEPSSLGVTVSVSSLRFGVQSAETQVSLDPMTDRISTRVSGPYHAGRRIRAIRNRALTISRTGVTKRDSLGHL